MSKLAKTCHNVKSLKDAERFDAISSIFGDIKSLPRLTTFVIQTEENLRN